MNEDNWQIILLPESCKLIRTTMWDTCVEDSDRPSRCSNGFLSVKVARCESDSITIQVCSAGGASKRV